jgi:hypothetical protein
LSTLHVALKGLQSTKHRRQLLIGITLLNFIETPLNSIQPLIWTLPLEVGETGASGCTLVTRWRTLMR